MINHFPPKICLRIAQISWGALILLICLWDGYFSPLNTGIWLLFLKLLPLCMPLRGILAGRVYTYQYCTMLILFYFAESVMRLWDHSVLSRSFAALEMLLSMVFFVACLGYVHAFKRKKS